MRKQYNAEAGRKSIGSRGVVGRQQVPQVAGVPLRGVGAPARARRDLVGGGVVEGVGGSKPHSMDPLKYMEAEKGVGPGQDPGEPGAVRVWGLTIDSLWMWFWVEGGLSGAVGERLAGYKVLAGEAGAEGVYKLPGIDVFIRAAGRPLFAYVLVAPGVGELAISTSGRNGDVRCRFASEYLASCDGLASAIGGMVAVVEQVYEAAVVADALSELHVAVDASGLVPTVELLQSGSLVTHAASPKVEAADQEFKVIQSLRFGGKRSVFSIAWYDKGKEIAEQSPGKSYLMDAWRSAGYDAAEHGPVYRLEGRVRREFLVDIGWKSWRDIDLPSFLCYFLGDGDGAGGYMSLRDVGTDSNKSRWSVSSAWLQLLAGALALCGVDRGYRVRRRGGQVPKYHALAKCATGILTSMGALYGAPGDLWSAVRQLEQYNDRWRGKLEHWWPAEVERKRVRYMVLPAVGTN